MRHSVLAVLLCLSLLLPVGADADRGQETSGEEQTEQEKNQIIHDLAVPWPFRKGNVTATAQSEPVEVRDSDSDGISDTLDRCPGTVTGARVDQNGCAIDSDGDGIPDGIDRCNDTLRGALVDEFGCSSDSDGDGVPDGLDKCDGTPADIEVDEYGCPVLTEGERKFLDTGLFTTNDITFESGKAVLEPESHAVLDAVGKSLSKWRDLEIEIGGHTDSQGAAAFNENLSQQRADAVRDYLVSNFSDINQRSLVTRGYGESNPVASNDTADSRARNRRVEFRLLNIEEIRNREEIRAR